MKTLLFNPGPTNVSKEVRETIKIRDICHREPEFFEVLLRLRKNILKVVNGEDSHEAIVFVSSGTGCNEAVIASIHGKVLVINNGKYSDRLCDIILKYNIPLNRLKFEEKKPIQIEKIEQELEKDKEITHIAMVHHETTTGVLSPIHEIGKLAKKYNKILFSDSISALGGHPLDVKTDNVGFCTVNGNKCIESFPGVSIVIGRKDLIEKLEGKSRSFYFDLYAQWKKELKGEMPFTPAVQLIFALDKAIQKMLEEGIENRIQRYKELAKIMRKGLKELGFDLILLSEEIQSNILTAIKMPESFDYWKIHDKLKERGITIYSGKETLDKGIFRVATLGSITEADVNWFLKNLKEVMDESRC